MESTVPLLASPYLEPIEVLHPPGDPEHSVSFARRHWLSMGWPVDALGRPVRGDARAAVDHHDPGFLWEPLWNVSADWLRQAFPQFRDQLLEDSYFSVCGMLTPRPVTRPEDAAAGMPKLLGAPRTTSTTVLIDGRRRRLPRAVRGVRWARGITAVWADLDCYRVDKSPGEVVGHLIDMQLRREIPPASMIQFSGRGLWVFWVLRDQEHAQRAVRAGWINERRWRRAQRAVHERLAHLGADAAAMDLARMTRVPGSRRTDLDQGSEVVVGWQIQGPPGSSKPFTYTLATLEKALGIQDILGDGAVARALDVAPHLRLRGQQGNRGRYFWLLTQLDALEDLRGGWRIGTRGRALWLQIACTVSVRRWTQRLDDQFQQPDAIQQIARLTEEDLYAHAFAIASRCESGAGWQPKSEAKDAVRRAIKEGGLGSRHTHGKTASHQTVADWLAVTPQESVRLEELGFKNPLPPARCYVPELPSCPTNRAAKAAARRSAIRTLCDAAVAERLPFPTLQAIAETLEESGLHASFQTIATDHVALGLVNPRGHGVLRQQRAQAEATRELPFGAV